MGSPVLPAIVLTFFSVCYLVYIVTSVMASPKTYWTTDIGNVAGLTVMYFLVNWSFYVVLCNDPMEPPSNYRLGPFEVEEFKNIPTTEGRQLYLYQLTFEKNLDIITRKSTGLIRYCIHCKLIKPDRAHHCSECGVCILKMDHHCPWLNNCIGYNNYKVFLLSSIYSLIYFGYFGITLAPVFLDLWDNGDPYYFSSVILAIFSLQLFLGAVILIFLIFHIRLLLHNETYVEHLYPPHFSSRRMTFNISPYANFKQVFGDKWRYWLIPTFSSKGDGCIFPYSLKRRRNNSSVSLVRSTPSVMSN